MPEKPWLVLIAGGHAAGKKLVCSDLANQLSKLITDIPYTLEIMHMANYSVEGESPQKVDFDRLKSELALKTDKIVLLEGLYALYDRQLRDESLLKVFVDSDADTRLSRWILRDIGDDEKQLSSILNQYLNHSRPEMNTHIAPTKQYADVILPRGSEVSGVELLATGIYDRIKEEMTPAAGASNPFGTHAINLQRETFQEQSQRFYDLS